MNHIKVLIIGSGIAALQLAKSLGRHIDVTIVTKSDFYDGNSCLAQGGVAAALSADDHPSKHYHDTMVAGRKVNNKKAVEFVTKEAPQLIEDLVRAGCEFDKDQAGSLELGLEGAHSEKRIVHSGGDETGKRIVHFIAKQLHDNVKIKEKMFAYELILTKQKDTCIGVKVKLANGKIQSLFADYIVIASGGSGQIYSRTSNAATATGDGLALAYIAGAELADLEFVQFHPTLLYTNGKAHGLISEAVRGEGATLITKSGYPIMQNVHPLKDLAPRHVVSQTIHEYIQKGEQVFFDIRNIKNFSLRFPTVYTLCQKAGVNISHGKIPVAPGCHFFMGGIKTDLYCRTNINRLFAVGEVACTGLHGSNRLASNSLLEGLAFGERLAKWLCKYGTSNKELNDAKNCSTINHAVLQKHVNINELKTRMMEMTGIVRKKHQLIEQKEWLESFGIEQLLDVNFDLLSVEETTSIFMLVNAWLVTTSALYRTETRGSHYRLDCPHENNEVWLNRQIVRQKKEIVKKGENNEFIEATVVT
ncbi:L-aspartate oxidase [Bacillus aquiflavi]|uniref:L-aspartate oxidase n=1 Tax=Bacillus aquiflavi TaxID=2672567 RepID=UPI001CA93311|nr:L-aspartate oxidase [Bacillus aquiflavi]UAC47403.1 L-aspartate oxidase [Bacillus aquiflavi]